MNYKNFNADDFAKDAFFIKWVKGDPESQWFWNTFLSEHPAKAGEIKEARDKVELLVSISTREVLKKEAFESMRNHLMMALKAREESEKERAHASKDLKHKPKTLRLWMGIAASLAIFISSALILRWNMLSQPHTLQTYSEHQLQSISTDTTELRINPRGQKSVMLLPDGTKVWLNADSKLTYAKNFGERDLREVYLEGEAFFDVLSNPARPFIVRTSDLNIKVLGTSFNVKSYSDDGRIETTLVEGRVEIDKPTDFSRKDSKVVLRPNQKATFSKESHEIKIKEVAASEAVAWRHDRLVFKSESFSEVIKQLERWYNVSIRVEQNENLSCPLTASIEKESLEEILDFLAVTHKISFTISGDEVFIKGLLCK
jgi:transmembrane sensor